MTTTFPFDQTWLDNPSIFNHFHNIRLITNTIIARNNQPIRKHSYLILATESTYFSARGPQFGFHSLIHRTVDRPSQNSVMIMDYLIHHCVRNRIQIARRRSNNCEEVQTSLRTWLSNKWRSNGTPHQW